MDRLFRSEGIVLKSIKLNESDKIVTIFSENYGKIRAITKGVRKTKSRFGSSMENLTLVKILVYRGKNLNIISQAEIIDSFFSNCRDLNRFGLAVSCSEIVNSLTVDEDPNQSIYELLKSSILLIKCDKNPILIAESFKWKLMTLLGYQPELKRCISCKKPILKKNHYLFDLKKGGILCSQCQKIKNRDQILIRDYSLRLLKRMIQADLIQIHNKEVFKEGIEEIKILTQAYLSFQFEIKSHAKHFLDQIRIFQG